MRIRRIILQFLAQLVYKRAQIFELFSILGPPHRIQQTGVQAQLALVLALVLIDIDRSRQLTDATTAQIFSDVDSAYEQLRSSIALLVPYKAQYRDQATRVRDTVTYAYQHGGASLMDFLSAQSDYRVVQLAYLQLIGSYMGSASQLNLAVGREVIP